MDKIDWVIIPEERKVKTTISELWTLRYLIIQFIHRDIVTIYRQSILGPIWFFLQPLLTTSVFCFVFGQVAGLSTNEIPKPVFYLSGIILWNIYSECVSKISPVFRDNHRLFEKIYFPRIVVPIATVAAVCMRSSIQILVLIFLWIVFCANDNAIHLHPTLFIAPIILLCAAFLGLGTGLLIAVFTIKYRDLLFVVSFMLQLLMYTTTVIYPLSQIPPWIQNLIELNPITGFIEAFRYSLSGMGYWSWNSLLYSISATLILFIFSYTLFQKAERSATDWF